MDNKRTRRLGTRLCLLVGLGLALGLGACGRSVQPAALPPRLLYFAPSTEDTLVLDEQGTERFILTVQASSAASYRALLPDSVLTLSGGEFLFRPADFGLVWPLIRQDSLITVRLELEDAGVTLGRSWSLLVSVTPGIEFIVEPAELHLDAMVSDTLHFSMSVANAPGSVQYRWHVNGTRVGDESNLTFIPQEEGQSLVEGHAWVQGAPIDLYHYWQVEVAPCDDQEPPTAASDLRIGPGPEPGDLVVRFTAAEDAPTGDPARYEIRFWDSLLPAQLWHTTYLIGLLPATPGADEEVYTIPGLAPGRLFFVRVRAQDHCGNQSAWSEAASGKVSGYTVSGRVLDWESGLGIPDLRVHYGRGLVQDEVRVLTDAEGRFYCPHVPAKVASESSPPGLVFDELGEGVGDWYDIVDTRAIDDSLYYEHGTFAGGPTLTGAYPEFLDYLLSMGVTGGLNDLGDDVLVHPHYPIPIYLPPLTANGIAYHELARNALAIWEADSGLDVFTEVATPAESAVEIIYTDEGYSSHRYTAWEPETGVPLRSEIRWVANGQPGSEASLQRVILHELGHALGPQRHSNEAQHVLATTNTVDRPAADELKLLRILYHMPARQDLSLLAPD
jgi:hypothetical protein